MATRNLNHFKADMCIACKPVPGLDNQIILILRGK